MMALDRNRTALLILIAVSTWTTQICAQKELLANTYEDSTPVSKMYFYQLGNDMVPGMNTFDMGLVAQYIECFYWGYRAWLDDFIHTSRYLANATFYDSRRIADLYLHSSELSVMVIDVQGMLDAMLLTTGYDPATFAKNSTVISRMNNYYSEKSNGIDRQELIFFRALFETLGDGLEERFGSPFYADDQDREITSICDLCAPYMYTSVHSIMPTTTNWYPSSSTYYQGPSVYFYQLGNDMVPGMNTFDMGLVAQYIECFYWGYRAWLDDFIHTSRYLANATFYDSRRIADLYLHSSELPVMVMDVQGMLDAMLLTTGYDPATFAKNSTVISRMNNYYSEKSNGIDRQELIFFRALFETLGDGLEERFGSPFYADDQDREITSICDLCAPYMYTSAHSITPTTTSWNPSSSTYYQGPSFYFYQLGNDMVPGMNTFDMGLVAQFIECFYWGYRAWLDDFIHTSRYLANATFYDSRRIADLYLHSSELPVMVMDVQGMLDAMLLTTGYDPATFAKNSTVISRMNNYYSEKSNGIDRQELIFFRALFETLGDGLKERFGSPFYADDQDKEITSICDLCAPYMYTFAHSITPTTTSWYPSSSTYYQGPSFYFYQLGNDMVPGMNTFDMGLVAQYIECFYWGYRAWLDDFIHTSRYLANATFYDSRRIADLYLHSSELSVMVIDVQGMLDAMLLTTGYDPATFAKNSTVISRMNNYYSEKSNGIDRQELIFFRALFETLGDGLEERFGSPFYADDQDREITSICDLCAPYMYTSVHSIMPTTTSWYPSSSTYYQGPSVYFYQLGNDMVPGMNTFDMGLVSQYIECFYWGYRAWLDDFIHTSRYLANATFYDSRRIADLYLHSSELPVMVMDVQGMLDAMLLTTGYDPATFPKNSTVISRMNNYYSEKSNGIDRQELIFFRALFETLGDGLEERFGSPFYADDQDKEVTSICDLCAPFMYTSAHSITPTTTSWYPSSSTYYQGPSFYFYQLGNDMVPGMNTFDMGLVAQYIECFYWGYRAWLDDFIHTSRYLANATFYDSRRIADLYLHSSELPVMVMDVQGMLDAMLLTTGYDPATFAKNSTVISRMNNYYSEKSNGIDRQELIFFRALFETLGDGLEERFGSLFYADDQDKEVTSICDLCAPFMYTSAHSITPTTTSWYPSSSTYYQGPSFYFYQLGNDMVPGMNTFDMGLVAQYIECFYWGYRAWLDDFIHTSRYLANATFYDSRRITDLYLHSSELPVMVMDVQGMLDAMLLTTGYDPATFAKNSTVISRLNNYYSEKSNGIDRQELIFFRALFETLGDGLEERFGSPFYADDQDREITSICDLCAPYMYTSVHSIMPTTTNWYPSSSTYYQGPSVYFYQLGNDMVPGMNTFDMGLVSQYIECFYWGYRAWLDDFIHTSRYLANATFYDSRRIADLYLHSSELPVMVMDVQGMLDTMLLTTGYDPATFPKNSTVISRMNNYYSEKSNGIDRQELIFFRALFETLGDGLEERFGSPFYADDQDKEVTSICDLCAPFMYTSAHSITPTTTSWYPSSSTYYQGPSFYFYQLGNDMVPGMNTFDMGLVAQYIECFYWGYRAWLDDFIHTSRYLANATFYDSRRIADLYLHSSELPVMVMDVQGMLDAMLLTTGYDPATFAKNSTVISRMNNYYSEKSNGIDRQELIFFRALFETLGDGLKERFGSPFYPDDQDKEITSIFDFCAPYMYTSANSITPTTTSWYPSSSTYYQGPSFYFYQLGNDMVPGMNTFDMGLVAQYIECFYWGYRAWLDDFIHTSRYLANATFYDSRRIADLYLHSSELPVMVMDVQGMLDAMLLTTGYDPATFAKNSTVISRLNNYYSEKSNGIDRQELIFFRALFETLGDGLEERFGSPFYADDQDKEVTSICDLCAPYMYTSAHSITPTTTSWYPSPSTYYQGPSFYFYQLGIDMVPGMNTFDMGLVAQYIECFYWGYRAWLDDFIHTSRYLANATFYDSRRIADLYLHSSELPVMVMDVQGMLDAMLLTTGYDPATFAKNSTVISRMNNYYSEKSNGIDRQELIFFRALFETLGDGLEERFGSPFYTDDQDKEITSICDLCAPYVYTSAHSITPTTTSWYPSSSTYYQGPSFYFYQLGNDMVPGMNTFDMGLVAQYIECFYWGYRAWLDDFIHTSRYLANATFYDSRRIADLYLHSSELPVMVMDVQGMLGAMLLTTGYDPATFAKNSTVISRMNNYYSEKSNGIDRQELIFFRAIFETLGDGLEERFGSPFYADDQDKEVTSICELCAPYMYTSAHSITPTTTSWYPSSSTNYQGPSFYFYQLGNDMVPGMNTFDMGLVAQYIECFYWGYRAWLDDFIHTSRYLANATFYDSRRIADLYLHSSELPVMVMDVQGMLDAMLLTTGYDPATFAKNSTVISRMNNYYSEKSNGIDRQELIFFRALFETLGDGLEERFGSPFYTDDQDKEITSICDLCAPYVYTSAHSITPTTTSWYPSSSTYYQGPSFYFYQLGNDMVPGMNIFDMGLVAQYIECFYWGYRAWLDDFIHTSRYLANATFYDSRRIADLYLHSSELPVMVMDVQGMLDAMLLTTGYDPATFAKNSTVISRMNNYYSEKSNGIDRQELIFFRAIFETLGDGLEERFGSPFYADDQDKEVTSICELCAPYMYTSAHSITPTTTSWYPSSSTNYQGPSFYFYQLGNDMVPGMNTFDMGLVAQYIECFYWGYRAWLDDFIHTSRYLANATFYDSRRIADLYLHSSELPVMVMDVQGMLDAMLLTTGYDPATFAKNSTVISRLNNYYSEKSNGIDRQELIFFRALFETLGDGLEERFGSPFYADDQDKEITSICDLCAPYMYTSAHSITPTTTSWYQSSSTYYQGPTFFFYQLGNDMVPGMNTFDMGLVAQYIECFYWGYRAWLDDFIHTSRYLANATFYNSRRIADLYLHSSELPVMVMDVQGMLDAMLLTTGYDPATFAKNSTVISRMNNYYSEKSNGIDRQELIFFRALFETLGDGLEERFGSPFYADDQDKEVTSICELCAPYMYTSAHSITPTTTRWYPSSSTNYQGPSVHFYQLGNDMVPGMNTFDMGLVAQYIECFYWGYRAWLDDFIHTSRYLANATFYDSRRIADLYLHSSELPVMVIDVQGMLDAMLLTTGYDPATFAKNSTVISRLNNYYSEKYNGIDRQELIFFRALFETLGDGLEERFWSPFYADDHDNEITSICDLCAPYSFTNSIRPSDTSYIWTSSHQRDEKSSMIYSNDLTPSDFLMSSFSEISTSTLTATAKRSSLLVILTTSSLSHYLSELTLSETSTVYTSASVYISTDPYFSNNDFSTRSTAPSSVMKVTTTNGLHSKSSSYLTSQSASIYPSTSDKFNRGGLTSFTGLYSSINQLRSTGMYTSSSHTRASSNYYIPSSATFTTDSDSTFTVAGSRTTEIPTLSSSPDLYSTKPTKSLMFSATTTPVPGFSTTFPQTQQYSNSILSRQSSLFITSSQLVKDTGISTWKSSRTTNLATTSDIQTYTPIISGSLSGSTGYHSATDFLVSATSQHSTATRSYLQTSTVSQTDSTYTSSQLFSGRFSSMMMLSSQGTSTSQSALFSSASLASVSPGVQISTTASTSDFRISTISTSFKTSALSASNGLYSTKKSRSLMFSATSTPVPGFSTTFTQTQQYSNNILPSQSSLFITGSQFVQDTGISTLKSSITTNIATTSDIPTYTPISLGSMSDSPGVQSATESLVSHLATSQHSTGASTSLPITTTPRSYLQTSMTSSTSQTDSAYTSSQLVTEAFSSMVVLSSQGTSTSQSALLSSTSQASVSSGVQISTTSQFPTTMSTDNSVSSSASPTTFSTDTVTAQTTQSSTTICVPGSGFCFFDAPDLGAHAGNLRPSTYITVISLLVWLLLLVC